MTTEYISSVATEVGHFGGHNIFSEATEEILSAATEGISSVATEEIASVAARVNIHVTVMHMLHFLEHLGLII